MRRDKMNTSCDKIISNVDKYHFIQPAINKEHMLHHESYTHIMLSIPIKYNLRHAKSLLQGLVDTPIGDTFKNPLKIGRPKYKVTLELKRHANFALNLLRITEKRMKK
jgi:hypothetical protein